MKLRNNFEIRDGKMLFWRLGNMNSNFQKHWNLSKDDNVPPVKRGIWCFPYPHYDYYFCYHQWESKLPKFYREEAFDETKNTWWEGLSEEEVIKHQNIKEQLMNKIKRSFKPKKFFIMVCFILI